MRRASSVPHLASPRTGVALNRLEREVNAMPKDVLAALETGGLLDAYRDRPAYQQNDYLGWIGGAKQAATRQKRIDQMLGELREGGVYTHGAQAVAQDLMPECRN